MLGSNRNHAASVDFNVVEMPLVPADSSEAASTRASGSSFYFAMRLMPLEQRQSMFEIYAFCRAVDDIADDGGPQDIQILRLQRWRADIDAIFAGAPRERNTGLAQSIEAYGLRREDFMAVIDGMEMDVLNTISGTNWDRLDLYCDRVASAVGRLCVRVFGMAEEPGLALAHHLGRGLQLTNILRDIDEDAAVDRLYLPEEALFAADIWTKVPKDAIAHPNIGSACAPVVARAEEHFRQSDAIFASCPRVAVRTPRIMAAAYRSILSRLVTRGWNAPRAAVKLRRSGLIWILFKCFAL
jgi:squalene synthase HpnD